MITYSHNKLINLPIIYPTYYLLSSLLINQWPSLPIAYLVYLT
jgi:hypothetical protein